MDNYKIYKAEKEDALFIAATVMGALGEELCIELAGGKQYLNKVTELFTRLAGEEESQYSYRNTFIAKSQSGEPIGAIIIYDGARLVSLRQAFIRAANDILGWNITEDDFALRGDETGPYEVYIDSIYVCPNYRGKGVATSLIGHAINHHRDRNKTYGLLVEPENLHAKKLYEKLGFQEIDTSYFFSTPMLHLQYKI